MTNDRGGKWTNVRVKATSSVGEHRVKSSPNNVHFASTIVEKCGKSSRRNETSSHTQKINIDIGNFQLSTRIQFRCTHRWSQKPTRHAECGVAVGGSWKLFNDFSLFSIYFFLHSNGVERFFRVLFMAFSTFSTVTTLDPTAWKLCVFQLCFFFGWAWARVEEDDVCQRGEIWKIYYTTINIFSFLPQRRFYFAFRWDFSACVVHGLPFLALPMEWGAHTFNLWNWTFNVSFPQQKYTKFRRFVINFFRGFSSFTPRKIQQFVFLSRAPRNVFAA